MIDFEALEEEVKAQSSHFQFMEDDEPLDPMPACCKDCAVENGFYGEVMHELMKYDKETQRKVASSWCCHNNPSKACAGIKKLVE